MKTKIKIPKHLQTEGRKFWKKVLDDFDLQDNHHLKLLEQACHCLDRQQQAREVIEAEGIFIHDRFLQRREHPAAKTERDNKIIFARLIRELGLDLHDPAEPRPKRLY